MKLASLNKDKNLLRHRWMVVAIGTCLAVGLLVAAQQAYVASEPGAHVLSSPGPKGFETPQQAAQALISAAEQFQVLELIDIFGPEGDDVVLTGEYAADHQRATNFAAQALEKMTVSVDPRNPTRAFVIVGRENWPFPVPIVKRGGKWYFDAAAGRQELLFRRIGYNELDVISICEGYVEAQHEYAWKPRQGYDVNQYAQHIISSPGKQDGLAWQNPDGSWGGPIGEKAAVAIAQGYSRGEPYHGYFFKILKGQGPAAPLGQMDFVINGAMIGGFALAAAPAEYRVTGVKTFIVSHDGIVYQKDLGPATLDEFARMDRYNPDKSWIPTAQVEQ